MASEPKIWPETTTVKWIIKDFYQLYKRGIPGIEFAHHYLFNGKGKFVIKKAISRLNDLSMYLYLQQLSCPRHIEGIGIDIKVAYDVEFESKQGDLIMIGTTKNDKPRDLSHYLQGDGWGRNVMKIHELRQEYLMGGDLTMRLTVRLYCGTKEAIALSDSTINEVHNETGLLKNHFVQGFGEALFSGQLSDVIFTFTSADDEDIEVKAHKLILSVRSPVFSAMFNTNMKEEITGKVMIEDLSAKAFVIMLAFMYTGKLNGDWGSVADELIYAANKYELTDLKNRLERKIMAVITVNNVIKIRKMAQLCNLKKAEEAIDMYVKEHVTEFLDTMMGNKCERVYSTI